VTELNFGPPIGGAWSAPDTALVQFF